MKVLCSIFASFILFSQPGICMAIEQQSGQSSDLAAEVLQMTHSLDELIHLLKAQQSKLEDFQKLQAAISYLSFRSRSIEMKQYELRFKKERRDAIESNIARIKDDPDAWDKHDKSFQTNNPATAGEPRPSELRLKLFQGRLDDANTEIIALETDIQISLDELASFESYVQKRLKLIK